MYNTYCQNAESTTAVNHSGIVG